jgi:hypothetical protein
MGIVVGILWVADGEGDSVCRYDTHGSPPPAQRIACPALPLIFLAFRTAAARASRRHRPGGWLAATAASLGGAAGGSRVITPIGMPVSKNSWSSARPIPKPNQCAVFETTWKA